MQKIKNPYIKYTRAELEHYTQLDESCVLKINRVEPIRFSPTIMADFQSSILRILSKKIGKYDPRLEGVVLDFRNTKISTSQSGIRQDSAFSVINVDTNFYVFAPRKGAVVTGAVKYISYQGMETVISVLIYRVFNVKVTIQGRVKQELEKNQEIQIRVKSFHFENVIPFIEGEIVDDGIMFKVSKKLFDDTVDSGISESSITSELSKERLQPGPSGIRIKKEELSDEDSDTPKKKRSRKRKSSIDSLTAPLSKRIKSEPQTSSSDDEPQAPRKRISSDSEDSLPPQKSREIKNRKSHADASLATKVKQEPIEEAPEQDSSSKKEKKAKKKKAKRNDYDDDDFETSLQILLEAQIKKKK